MDNVTVVEQIPMSDGDIKFYFPNAPIYKYSELAKFNDINQLFKTGYFFLLYQDSKFSGHWIVCAIKDNDISFFDSYGYRPDDELEFVNCATRKELGTTKTLLTDMFNKSKYNIYYNNYDYQGRKNGSQTCGRHCCNFLRQYLTNNMDLEDYYKYMSNLKKKTKKSYDKIVSMIISK